MEKVVIVTGATSGYGLATAKKFKQAGYVVVAASRNAEKVQAVAKEYGFDGYVLDVTDYSQWLDFQGYILEKYGKVDVLVNNAGGGVAIKETDELDVLEIDQTISLNLNSVIYGSNLFGGVMKEQRYGTIVNISSVCAKHCWAGWSVYAAAKAGVLNFTKGLYVELQPYGARATCIIPAAASTSFQKSAGIAEENQTLTPEDIADAVFYAATAPEGIVVEEMTVWGTSQRVQPL